jgi:hypothetical protein
MFAFVALNIFLTVREARSFAKNPYSGKDPDYKNNSMYPNVNVSCSKSQEKGKCYLGCRTLFGTCDCVKHYSCDITGPTDTVLKKVLPESTDDCASSGDVDFGCSYQETGVKIACKNCDINNDIENTCPFSQRKDCVNTTDLSTIIKLCKHPDDVDAETTSKGAYSTCVADPGCKLDGSTGCDTNSCFWPDLKDHCPSGFKNTCAPTKMDAGCKCTSYDCQNNQSDAIKHISRSALDCDWYYTKCYKYPSVLRNNKCRFVV